MTKYLTAEVIKAHSGRLSADFKKGRAEAAPNLSGVLAYWQMDQDEGENSEEEWLAELQQRLDLHGECGGAIVLVKGARRL